MGGTDLAQTVGTVGKIGGLASAAAAAAVGSGAPRWPSGAGAAAKNALSPCSRAAARCCGEAIVSYGAKTARRVAGEDRSLRGG